MKKLSLIFALLILAGLSAGVDFEVNTLDSEASTDSPAEFDVEVNNPSSDSKSYRLSVLDYHRSQWYSHDSRITVNSSDTDSFSLTVNPGQGAIQGSYSAEISVREIGSDETFRESIRYTVSQENDLNLIGIEEQSPYSPGEEFELGLNFRNVDDSTTEYKDVEVEVLNQTETVELGPIVPGGERRITASFEADQYEPSGEKQLQVRFDDRTHTDTVTVEEIRNITSETDTQNRFLVVNQNTEIKNEGNTPENHTYSIEKPSYISPVVYAPGAEEQEVEGATNYTWTQNLQPGETATLELRTDYWIPVTGLLLLLGGFLGLKKLTSNVTIQKTVTPTEEGLDVKIEVENSSSKTFDDVLLEDFIPNIAELDSNFEMADPEVKHTDQGSELKWWINEMHPGDQRIYKYTIRPKVEVEGGVKLDPAILRDGNEILSTTEPKETEFKPE